MLNTIVIFNTCYFHLRCREGFNSYECGKSFFFFFFLKERKFDGVFTQLLSRVYS